MGYFLEIHISRNLEFEWNLSANAGDAGDVGSIPGSGRSPRGMATHSSIFAWKTPWTEEPYGLQSMGLHRAGHD